MEAVLANDHQAAQLLLDRGADVNQQDQVSGVEATILKPVVSIYALGLLLQEGRTALMMATEGGDQTFIQLLVERNAIVNMQDSVRMITTNSVQPLTTINVFFLICLCCGCDGGGDVDRTEWKDGADRRCRPELPPNCVAAVEWKADVNFKEITKYAWRLAVLVVRVHVVVPAVLFVRTPTILAIVSAIVLAVPFF